MNHLLSLSLSLPLISRVEERPAHAEESFDPKSSPEIELILAERVLTIVEFLNYEVEPFQ